MKKTNAAKSIALVAFSLLVCGASPSPTRQVLMAGAARIDITPHGDELVAPFARVNDPVHVRAVVVDSAGARVVIVVAEVPMIQAGVAADLVRRIAELAGVPQSSVLISVSHTHNTMRVDPNPGGTILPGSPRFTKKVSSAILQAVQQSIASLRPARMGMGAGKVYLVGAKNSWSALDGRWIEAVDRSGEEKVSHALGVIKFETLDGKPIALLLNYAINPVIAMNLKDAISGDVPGAASLYVEERSGEGAVALFTIGASGNPLYRAEPDNHARPADANALMTAMGTILGEEALAVSQRIVGSETAPPVESAFDFLICPGKVTAPLNLPDRCSNQQGSGLPLCDFKDRDAEPVSLKLGVIKLGSMALVQSDSDVSAPVGLELERRSPFANTWIVTTNYGPMRYVVADADYPLNTYEATASAAKRGCAEQGYLGKALSMMNHGKP